MVQQIFITLGLIILGFLIAEFQNAFLGKQEKISTTYFTIIDVSFTEKNFQRLLFAITLGIGLMFLLPKIIELTGLELNGYIVYIITGYSPSTVMLFVKKKVKQKAGVDIDGGPKDRQSITGGMADPKKEQRHNQ